MIKQFVAFATFAFLLAFGATAEAGRLEDIQAAGVIRIGISLTGEPIGFRDAGNNPTGYDVVVAQRLADAIGVRLEVVEVGGAVRTIALQSNQVDVIIANMTATVERAKAVNFSIPYLRTGLKLLVRGDSGIASLADLRGKRVIVGRGTTGEVMIRREVPDAELVYADNFASQILLLTQGRADATLDDGTLLDFAALQNPGLVALAEIYTSDPISIAIAKGDLEFLRFLDIFVSDYISTGAYQENYTNWFGQPGPPLTPLW
jgi:ABC-type amino acid transport substrate-binding protein